jgi:hypothetical protein
MRKILTWPPLWQYWPLYLGIAMYNRGRPDDEQFMLATLQGDVTDSALSGIFYKEQQVHYALGIFGRAQRDRRDLKENQILIHRQPHWIYYKVDHYGGSAKLNKIYCYNADSTSGAFSRRLINDSDFINLVLIKTKHKDLMDHEKVPFTIGRNELDCLRKLTREDLLITFTPWHRLKNGNIDCLPPGILHIPIYDEPQFKNMVDSNVTYLHHLHSTHSVYEELRRYITGAYCQIRHHDPIEQTKRIRNLYNLYSLEIGSLFEHEYDNNRIRNEFIFSEFNIVNLIDSHPQNRARLDIYHNGNVDQLARRCGVEGDIKCGVNGCLHPQGHGLL